MKTIIVKQSALGKQLDFRSHLLVVALVLYSLLYANPVFATDVSYEKTPPKITSSIDCLPPSMSLATIRPVRSGLWTQASTWPNGQKPSANDDVVVPPGIELRMVGTCRARNINVQGKLSAVNYQSEGAWIELRAQSIVVANGGLMEIGTEAQPYFADKGPSGVRCQITLTGSKITNSPASRKAILVQGGGRLELHGKKRISWTNLSATANAGSKQITLKRAVDWEVGDKIALTATGLASGQSKAWNNVDEAEITAISGNRRTLTLKSTLKYTHIGGSKSYKRARDGKTWNVNIQGEVGLLSHYIKIQGDETNNDRGYGGHIMLMKNSTAHAEHIELYRMGQKAILGRYPFHWHLNEDKAKGSYLKNSSVHKSFNRAVTIHGTDYVTVDGVFAYDHVGHGIFFEDGGERFNTVKNNVVFVTRRPKKGEELTPSDNQFNQAQNRTPASFWITNPNNYFENNVAAGTEGTGFWFAFPDNGPLMDSRQIPYYKNMVVWKQPLGKFDGFVAHTCMTGWDVFDRLNDEHGIKANWGWDVGSRQLIRKGLFYGNDQAIYSGLGVGGKNQNTVFYDCAFSDNRTISMLAGDLTIENSLFNVDSDFGVFNGTREFFRFYDGPGRHINCHFEGWNRSNAEMIKQIVGGGATENFNPTFRGTTKGFSGPFPFRYFALPQGTRARTTGQFFKDYDGSFLGKKGTLIRDIAFLRDGHEYRHPSWKNAARSDYFFASLWMAAINSSGTKISIVRSKPGTSDACFYESGAGSSGTYKFPMIVNEGFTYTYHFDRAPSNKSIHLIWNRGDRGDEGMTCFKGLGKLGNFRVNGHNFTLPRLNSRGAVANAGNSAYFIDGNGDVYIKFKATSNNPDDRVNIFLRWDNNGSFKPATLPCTTNDLSPGGNTNNTPPTVSFQSPSGSQFNEGANLGVVVNAKDSDGSIANVRLFINNALVRQEGLPPYEWGTANADQNDNALLNLQTGTYTLRAVATDNKGATATATKKITVGTSNGGDNSIVHMRKRNASGFALDGGTGGAPDQSVKLYQANPTNINQQWIEINRGNGYYSYQKVNTNYCMDGGSGGERRQNVKLWNCEAANQNQHWRKVLISNNIYRLEKRNANGFSIDGNNGGTNDQLTYLWDSSNSNQNQHWVFQVVGTNKNNLRDIEDALVFYPNPIQNTLFISGNTAGKIIKIYDVLGAMKVAKKLTEGENSIDFSGLASGYYIARIKSTDNSGLPDQILKILKN